MTGFTRRPQLACTGGILYLMEKWGAFNDIFLKKTTKSALSLIGVTGVIFQYTRYTLSPVPVIVCRCRLQWRSRSVLLGKFCPVNTVSTTSLLRLAADRACDMTYCCWNLIKCTVLLSLFPVMLI